MTVADTIMKRHYLLSVCVVQTHIEDALLDDIISEVVFTSGGIEASYGRCFMDKYLGFGAAHRYLAWRELKSGRVFTHTEFE